nr:4Fe-4S binding protein [Deltaproteobacteria bacterium]
FYWGGQITDEVKEIHKPLVTYLRKGRSETPQHIYRYVPVNKVVDHALQAVYTYDMMVEVVRKATKIAVVHCPCRQRARLVGGNACTHTLENCIKFNRMAEFVIERGLGREITTEEALEIIRKSEEEGLIHFVDNCQEDIQHNCNCCSCCCWNVAPIKKRLVPRDYIMATYYLRTTDEDACVGCGQCAEDCPMEIITMEGDLPVIDESICIGCGVCLLHCPTDAAKLKKKGDSIPAKDFTALHQEAIKKALLLEKVEG